jgi:dienelactone hydrolase
MGHIFATLLILVGVGTAVAGPAEPKVVDIKADDGTLLKGTYYAAAKRGPGVLLLHMCNSRRTAWATLAPRLVAQGLHVLAVDYRGYGDSGGEPFATWTPPQRQQITRELWPKDLDRALAFLESQPDVDRARIGAAGASCGVDNAIQLARRHPEVLALALLAGGTDPEGERFLERTPWVPLFVAGAQDDNDAAEAMAWLAGFSSNPVNQVTRYPTGGHGTELFRVHAELEPAITAWFARHLVAQPVVATPGGAAKPGPSSVRAAALRSPGGAKQLLAALRARQKVELPPEGALNNLGYGLLQARQTAAAIDVFTLNMEAHPDSANTYDSLGDAYLAAGDRVKAASLAKRALDAMARDKRMPDELRKALRTSAESKLR